MCKFLILVAVLVCAFLMPATTYASKTCHGVCSGATDAVACKAGCAVTTGLCKAQDEICKAACKFGFTAKKRRRCRSKCRRKTVEPCKRKLVRNCENKCRSAIVRPCENRCNKALPRVCRMVMDALPPKLLREASVRKENCYRVSAPITVLSAGIGSAVGVSVANPPAGAVVGAVIGQGFSVACVEVHRAKTDFKFKDAVCAKLF